ncbi:MAG TPA: ATP-binding protein, partial [Bacteroidales bacterium]|nr:ATP-binding protein [Bacteroidales bacterium]
IGRIYAEKGDYTKGEKNLKKAIQILKKLNDAKALISFNIRLSDIYQQEGQLDEALKIANDCYHLARQNGLRAQIRDACEKLFELYRLKEDYRQAFLFQSQYIAYKDSINNEATIRKMADIRTQYEVEKKQTEVDRMAAKRRLIQWIAIGLGVVVLLVLILSWLLYRSTRRKTILNNLLSEQKEELQIQHEQLETLNQTKDRFFSIISHDLRGPIGAMSTLPFLFREYMDNNDMESVRELVGHLDNSVQQISHLLDNLLEWALSQQGGIPCQPEKLILSDILRELHNTYAPMAVSKKLQLLVSNEGGIIAWADKNSLLTILRNLLNNAVKFTAPGGMISLSATGTDEEAVIIVSDTGVGMKKEQLENLFHLGDNKSTPGTENEKGVGLGLTLVYDFVRMNKGTIDVESEAGKGTRFILKIPVRQEDKN